MLEKILNPIFAPFRALRSMVFRVQQAPAQFKGEISRAQAEVGAVKGDMKQYAASAKVFATQTAFEVAHDAIQTLGGNGLTHEYLAEKLFRDARASLIEDGENSMLGLMAASRL